MAMPAARAVLRSETGDLHTTLDGLLSRTDFDAVASYADFLIRQAAPLFAVEAAIDVSPLASALPDWAARQRSAAIRSDLTGLGAALPAPASFAPMSDSDTALGALYVLEGSRLGAKFLVKSAQGSRDASVRAATAYLGHGEGESFWPRFLAFLAMREADGLDHQALVTGARAAFAAFIDAAQSHAALQSSALKVA